MNENVISFQKIEFDFPLKSMDEVRLLQKVFRFVEDAGEEEDIFVAESILEDLLLVLDDEPCITLHHLEIDIIECGFNMYEDMFDGRLPSSDKQMLSDMYDRLMRYKTIYKKDLNRFFNLTSDQQVKILTQMYASPHGEIAEITKN